MSRLEVAPRLRADSMYASSRTAMTSPRSNRTKLGTNTMAMAMDASLTSAPSSAATVRARISGGKEKRASIARMITESTAPRKNPAIESERDGDHRGQADDFERRPQRNPSAPDQTAQDVASEVVRAEPVRGRRPGVDGVDVLDVRRVGRDQRSEDCRDDHDQEEDQAGDGPTLMEEPDPEARAPFGQLVGAVPGLGDRR